MAMTIFIIVLLLHFLLASWVLFRPSSPLRSRREYRIPVFFLLGFGPLIAITIDILDRTGRLGKRPFELETVKAEHDIFWASIAARKDDQDAVPLEEAILLNDRQTRRKAVLSTFRDEAFRYLDVLMLARNDEDADTTHYATIQITKIQREFQLKLQKFAVEHEKDPQNLALLDEYIALLETYLQSRLPEKSILRHQQEVFDRLLDERLALVPDDKMTLIRKLRNWTDIRENYPAVLQLIERLKKTWPDDELVWIESLRAFVEWKDSARIQQITNEMKSRKVQWTKWGRQQISPWVQVR